MNTNQQANPAPFETTRRKGNVARLTKQFRDKINSMLDDGATYPEIIADLENSAHPPLPYPIIQICKLMDELTNPKAGETDAEKCARITNSLSRLSRSVLLLEKHRAEIEKSKVKNKSAEGLTKEQIAEIHEAMRML